MLYYDKYLDGAFWGNGYGAVGKWQGHHHSISKRLE